MCPTGVWAAGSTETTTQVPVWLCIPFAGLLLCIAVMPLIKAEWWEAHQPHVVLMWILLMIIPFAVVYGAGKATETVLECIVNDYLTFIVLLFGLFCVSACFWNTFVKLHRNYRSKYADGSSCHQDEFMEKKKEPYHGILHLYGFQHGRMPDTNRRSAASDGLYAWRSVFLESASVPGTSV